MLRTSRLVLRRWRDEDRAPFAALNADPAVMRYFPRPLTRAESDLLVDRIEASFEEHGYGLWAVDVAPPGPPGPGTYATGFVGFIGFVGLAWQRFPAHFTPALEIGWRLARHGWGKGYATEAAMAVRDFAFRPAAVASSASGTADAPDAAAERLGSDSWLGPTGGAGPARRAGAVSGAGMDEIVSITTRTNERSQAVMRRIGMTRDSADDFRHPNLEPDHPLVEHVLYRLRRPDRG